MPGINDILRNMPDELFEDGDADIGVQVMKDGTTTEVEEEHPPVYQEDIPNAVAQGLLSKDDYDPECHYQLIQSMDTTVVLKIDDRVTQEEEEAAIAKDPETTHLHLREIVLESSNDDVESYSEMHQAYVGMNNSNNKRIESIIARPELLDYDLKKHHNWGIIICAMIILILLGIGVSLFLLIYQYFM